MMNDERAVPRSDDLAYPVIERSTELKDRSVKICGLQDPKHARAAVAAGADLVGFVFAPARRQVTGEVARASVAAARDEAGRRGIQAVGVFVNATAGEINRIASYADLDLVQLHGDESAEMLEAVERPVVKALRLPRDTSLETATRLFERYRVASRPPIAFLVDGYSELGSGGEGVQADWSLATLLARSYRVVLAGGLNARNVASAIRAVQPIGVDVSSGVETDGRKDVDKIWSFVQAARAALTSLPPV